MRKLHSKNSIFLMEIILNVLLFAVLLTIGLQFFVKAHRLTEKTTELHQAVSSCESAASVFQSGDGTLASLLETYHYSVNLHDRVVIYLDSSFNACPKKSAAYTITAALDRNGKRNSLSAVNLTCSTTEGMSLYSLRACHFPE